MDKDFAIMKFKFMSRLTILAFSMAFILFASVIFMPIPAENTTNVGPIVQFVINMAMILIGYYYGMSQSTSAHAAKDQNGKSPEKDENINTLGEKKEGEGKV